MDYPIQLERHGQDKLLNAMEYSQLEKGLLQLGQRKVSALELISAMDSNLLQVFPEVLVFVIKIIAFKLTI